MPEGVTSGPAPAGLCIGLIGGRTVPIPAWIDLLKDAAIAAAGTPVAIVLPDTALAAEATALLCARDMAARYARAPTEVLAGLPTGHRVRVLPDEGVYEFCGPGDGGYWLQLLDVSSGISLSNRRPIHLCYPHESRINASSKAMPRPQPPIISP